MEANIRVSGRVHARQQALEGMRDRQTRAIRPLYEDYHPRSVASARALLFSVVSFCDCLDVCGIITKFS